MINIIIRNILSFIALVLIQILILNNIQLSGFINPYLYIMFLLLLPFETPGWAVLILSFLLGLSIDAFTNTLGMHTSATVFLGFIRGYVLKILAPREGYEAGTYPRIQYYGLGWFLRYTIILTLAHHFFLFYIEVFRFSDFFFTFYRAFLSSIFTIVLIIISQYIIFKNK